MDEELQIIIEELEEIVERISHNIPFYFVIVTGNITDDGDEVACVLDNLTKPEQYDALARIVENSRKMFQEGI